MTIVKFFIAGAKSLKDQRLSMKALANDLNTKYEREGRDISINMYSYENFGERQTAYDYFIKNEADMVIFIVDGKLGQKTEAELRLAVSTLKKNKKPEIVTFVHTFAERTEEIDYLEKVINSLSDKYYVDYSNTEDLLAKAKERINIFIRKRTRTKIRAKLLKLTAGLCSVFGLVIGCTLLFTILNNQQQLYINIEDMPTSLSNSGITKDFITQQVITFLPELKNDANKKLNEILTEIADENQHADNEIAIIDRLDESGLGDINIIPHRGKTLQKLRRLLERKDVSVNLKILETDSLIVSKVSMEDWNKEKSSITIEERKDAYPSAQKCAVNVILKNIAFIASAYSPVASSLFDYEQREGLGEYEMESPWREYLYKHEERRELIERSIRKGSPDSSYCKLLLANYFENMGVISRDTMLLRKACTYYGSFGEGDSVISFNIHKRIQFLKDLYGLDRNSSYGKVSIPEQLMNNGVIPSDDLCKQLIIVHGQEKVWHEGKSYYMATLHSYERLAGKWEEKFSPFKVNLGIKGIASMGHKKEGDLMTPSGYYALPLVFGYKKDIATKMDFLEVNRNHVWICDTSSEKYNTLIEDSAGTFFNNPKNERLLRHDHINKYAIVIDYNTNPIVNGKGSAIFMHVERSAYHKTAGCISIPEEEIIKLIKWLDPSMQPHIFIAKKL